MKDVDIISKIVARKGEAIASPSKGAASVDMSGYLLRAIWDRIFEVRSTEHGEEYIFCKTNFVSQFGVTTYADEGSLDLPSIYDGLVIDNQTIVWEEVDGVKTLMAKGGGSGSGEGTIKDVVVNGEGNAITNVILSADKTELVFAKGMTFAEKTYVDSNFYTKTYIDDKFVTLDTYQSIYGGKNFVGGLYVNGGEIKYNGSYWELDGDLLVTGGITAFADRYDPTSIMDAIVTDEQTITVEKVNGVKTLKVIGGGSGGGVDEEVVKDIIDSYLTGDKLPVASTSSKGIASFDSNSFNVSSGHVTFNGGKIKVVNSTPSRYESNTLYVIVG